MCLPVKSPEKEALDGGLLIVPRQIGKRLQLHRHFQVDFTDSQEKFHWRPAGSNRLVAFVRCCADPLRCDIVFAQASPITLRVF